MKPTLVDFGLVFDSVPLYCDDTSSINLSKNPIQHSRTKHIYVKHTFIRDLILKGEIRLNYIPTKYQVTNNFTKAFSEDRFRFLKNKLVIIEFSFSHS